MRHVKGVLFADYIRMIRSQKDVPWRDELHPEDLPYLAETIDAARWFPMESFERLGNAILKHNAGGNIEAVRMWGRFSADPLAEANPMLVAPKDPVETLSRFRILRSTYFDFDTLDIPLLIDGQARVEIRYQMGAIAEEAAALQTMGFFERLLELAGATSVTAAFTAKAWEGAPSSVLELTWVS